MNAKHRAYSLIELLVILVVVAAMTALSVRPLRTLISEIPRSARICQTLNATTNALKQIKKDVEQATIITGFKDSVLTLQHVVGPVIYTLTDGQITRRPGINEQDAEYTWQLPHLRIETNLWGLDDEYYAVELKTWNQQRMLGKEQCRFKQSTVFFQKGKQ